MSSHLRSRNNTFANLELERFAEQRGDAGWLSARVLDPCARFLVLREDGRLLVTAGARILRELAPAERERLAGTGEPTYLCHAAGADRFLLRVDETRADTIANELGAEFVNLRHAGRSWPAFEAGLFAYALGVANWQSRTRYCSNCAAPLQLEAAGHRAKCTNPQCGMEHFPRTDPAVMALVRRGSEILLGRSPHFPPGMYSALAGFVEPGETLEQCIAREVLEEVGVSVTNVRYFASQPWPFPNSLMIAFFCDYAGGKISPQETEIEAAEWFDVFQLPKLPSKISIARRLIDAATENMRAEGRRDT